MAVKLSFLNADISLPIRFSLESRWSNIKDPSIIYFLTIEEQNLFFLLHLLENLQATNSFNKTSRIDLSVRAGFIKNIVIIYGAIIETSLRCLLEQRGTKIKERATLGYILTEWGVTPWSKSTVKSEISPIQNELNSILQLRNSLHLYEQARALEPTNGWDPFDNPVSTLKEIWGKILAEEEIILENAKRSLDFIKSMNSK